MKKDVKKNPYNLTFTPCPSEEAPTPFQDTKEAQFFIYRTTGGFSRLDASDETFSIDMLGNHFPVGYTNLWLMQRVALYPKDGEPILYPDIRASTKAILESQYPNHETRGHYYIFGDDGTEVIWVEQKSGELRCGFDSAQSARQYLWPMREPGVTYMIAVLLDDIYWH